MRAICLEPGGNLAHQVGNGWIGLGKQVFG